jgi:hypothetical protein
VWDSKTLNIIISIHIGKHSSRMTPRPQLPSQTASPPPFAAAAQRCRYLNGYSHNSAPAGRAYKTTTTIQSFILTNNQ